MKVKAFAKINLTLDIVGKRNDGYHYVDMIMQTVSLYDEITVNLNSTGAVSVTSTDSSLGGENDITYKAARLFFDAVDNSNVGADISVIKHIPAAAGLGGGSSDAAAVICALNKLCSDPLDYYKISALCLKLGADVPYFVKGGTVRVTGIGEKFEPLCDMPNCSIIIAKKDEKPSTAYMYGVIDNSVISDRPCNCSAVKALNDGNLTALCKQVKNVFSTVWTDKQISDILRECGADAVSVSGSGPSVFGIFAYSRNANSALKQLKDRGITAFIAEPQNCGMIFE